MAIHALAANSRVLLNKTIESRKNSIISLGMYRYNYHTIDALALNERYRYLTLRLHHEVRLTLTHTCTYGTPTTNR